MMDSYVVRDRSGNVIANCRTMIEAEETIRMYEAIDKDARIFTPDFYEIAIRYSEADGTFSYFGV